MRSYVAGITKSAVLVLLGSTLGRAAQGGTWETTYAWSGSCVTIDGRGTTTTAWTASGNPANRRAQCQPVPCMGSGTASASSIGSVVATLTWHPAPENPTEKPAAQIWVRQDGNVLFVASFAPYPGTPGHGTFDGEADNGLLTPPLITSTTNGKSGSCNGLRYLLVDVPLDEDPIVIELPRVDMRATAASSGPLGTASATADCISYAATVPNTAPHAHPTNMRVHERLFSQPGTLLLEYIWDATTKPWSDTPNPLAPDLDNCQIREYDLSSGDGANRVIDGVVWFVPADPPWVDAAEPNPKMGPTPPIGASAGKLVDLHTIKGLAAPYHTSLWRVTQYYQFHCGVPGCMAPGEWQALRGPLIVDRYLYSNGEDWWFQLTKEGFVEIMLAGPG